MQLSAFTSSVARFFSELQRRKVLRVASVYLVAAWIILQVALALQTAMSLASSFSTFILALLVICFPIVLSVSWFFEFTSEGIRRTVASSDGTPFKPQTTDFVLAGALALVFSLGVAQFFWPRDAAPVTQAPAAVTPVADVAQTPRLGDKSIAVLPFANLSPDKENEYFADGLTEEILNIIAQIRGLKVISRTSSFAFKGKETPLPEIAKRLGVRHILEGSVRRNGDDIRVTAQLIDVTTDVHIWSQTYERKLADVFALQEEMARAIASALNVEVSVSAGGHEAPTKNMEAYRLFLNAREIFFFRRRDGDVLESLDLYRRATELDPTFAAAHVGLASSYAQLANANADNYKEFAPKAQQAVTAGLALDPNASGGFRVLGVLARMRLDWNGAITNYSKAVSIDPADSLAMGGLGTTLLFVGKFEQGNRYIGEAERIDPVYNRITAPLKMISAFMRRDDDTLFGLATILVAPQSPATAPAQAFGHATLAFLAREDGDGAVAEKHFRMMMKLSGRDDAVTTAVVPALKSRAAFGAAEKALSAEAARNPKFDPESVFLVIGDEAAYLDALMARLARGDTARTAFWTAFIWRSKLSDETIRAKFKTFVRAAGLVDYWKKYGWPDRCQPKGDDDFDCT